MKSDGRILRPGLVHVLIAGLVCSGLSHGQTLLVEDGQPRAEIVIAADPPRTTLLAAKELQHYVEKISGATLPIVPDSNAGRTPVYVGASKYTQQLGLTTDGLKHGAYRIVSGDGWLALLGQDVDFVPKEPWPRGYADIRDGKMQQEWNKITGAHWGYPHSQLFKHYSGAVSLFGTPNEQRLDKEGNVNVWTYDERGSFNAVCGLLHDLGVRWYLPGELGEVLPRSETILIPKVDKTVRPDFSLRTLNFRAGVYGRDVMMWGFRLGVRQVYGRQAAHGLETMTNNEHTLAHHPDWFALYGGRRHTQSGERLHQLCYSNEELFRETVRFVRAQFDQFDMDVVSVMPPDGYTAICQCPECGGKETPDRGRRGAFSDYVWEFVQRVAVEVAKTHPDRKISSCAYGTYTLPPRNIDKLASNIQVIIVGGRRPTDPDRESLRQLRRDWAAKTDNPIEIFENYPFTGRGFYLPAFIPKTLGESINETKGQSQGEDVWITMDFSEKALGYNHFLLYFTARMYWGGKDQNVVEMFDEYCRLFYGPAAEPMRAFFLYCEDHWREMETDLDKASRALELFAAAKSAASPETVYARRIALIDNYLEGLRNKVVRLAQKRGPAPRLRLVSGSRGQVVVDGKLDDEPWANCPAASTGTMHELQTGRRPIYGTSIKTAWIGDNLYFAIRCDERPADKVNVATTKDDDPSIWYGDAVEILLDTDSHSYYQLVVNPAGALVDLDRGADKDRWFEWDSQAEVATHVADDHWTVEIRIPITQDENDPLHQVVGRKPTQSLPWYVNICRQRIREEGAEYSAFAPTGSSGFHHPMKFAYFYGGLSHEFPIDPTVTDYLIASRAAEELYRNGRTAEAMQRYVALAADKSLTPLQVSDALEQAARCARRLGEIPKAEDFAGRIPLPPVAKTVRMENLLAKRAFKQVMEEFAGEDLQSWPVWQRGAGSFARGQAYAAVGAGEKAEADFQRALEFTSDSRIRMNILTALANNRERNLKDDDAALAAYRENFESASSIGGADQFHSLQGAARILTRQGKFDEALATLRLANIDELKGFWRCSMLLALGDVFAAAGKPEEAVDAYRKAGEVESAPNSLRKEAIRRLERNAKPGA